MTELVVTERVAMIIHKLAGGAEMTTSEIAALGQTTWGGAEKLCDRASRVTPLVKEAGVWRMLREDDERAANACGRRQSAGARHRRR